ncbi:hypothetical protein Pdw03_3594 [Penicillium digitatum]|uniref:Uncharacterized protein n=3 Tax=Penicillium digitatum TaxID=36651 RepID=K9FIW8_PEND2|nr:hypothetical protein PDIP_78610 [Penicillium digitatum Pd1]EKV06600.1 hypothetical protein PDIP_78610 [Penicillium digitatum Pd1]EKV08167.1 hypothetical protein PDIG_69320 [Penicillium digitatum PHI26]QQK40740.1 hypothetical protein Pdw03_3594 [Penicillium digitatum]
MHTQSNLYRKRSLSETSATSTSSHTSQFSQEKKRSRLSKSLLYLFRSKSPVPIDNPHRHENKMSPSRNIPRRNHKAAYFLDQHYTSTSPTQMSISMGSSTVDIPKRASTPTRKNSGNYKRYNGTVNHYGRHSNDWLFGGFSVRETVRDSLEKLRGQDKES